MADRDHNNNILERAEVREQTLMMEVQRANNFAAACQGLIIEQKRQMSFMLEYISSLNLVVKQLESKIAAQNSDPTQVASPATKSHSASSSASPCLKNRLRSASKKQKKE